MKTRFILLLLSIQSLSINAQNVGINTDGSNPDPDAQLHIKTNDFRYGLFNELTTTSSGPAYGVFNKLPSASTGVLFGTYNSMDSDLSLEMYGTFNKISGDGDQRKYGTFNDIDATSGFAYGTFTTINSDGNDFAQIGTLQTINGSGNGEHFGTRNLISGSGTGRHVSVISELGGIGNSRILGISNTISNIGSGIHLGVENIIEGGQGDHYGVHNTLLGTINNSGDQYGMYSLISNSGDGIHYGSFTELSGTGAGLKIGNQNKLSSSSDSEHWGIFNEVIGSGSGSHKGSYNLLLGSGAGNQIGSDQQITISGNGIHAGTSNSVNGIGSGTHYGSKNSLSGTGSGDQYATHNEITNSASGTKYGTYNAINTGTGTHYAGWFDAAGTSNNYAAVFNRGDVVANESGGNYDFRVESSNENGMLFVDGTNDRLGIGTDAPNSTFHMTDDDPSGRIALIENTNTGTNADGLAIKLGPTSNPTSTNAYIAFRDGDNTVIGSITGDGAGGTNFNTTSDRRLKMNIHDFEGSLSMVKQIKAREYERISNPGQKEIGFIAQELYEVFPQIVSGTPEQSIEDPMTVDYGKLTPVLLAAIQELAEQNQILKEQLAAQRQVLEVVVKKLETLEIKQ